MEHIKIAIADDEKLFREGLKLVIDSLPDIDILIEAANGQELLDQLDDHNDLPDVLLLDMQMPVMDGVKTTQSLHKRYPSIHIIILSTHFKKSFILNMIEMGASSYLGKDTDPDELSKTIREVVKNGFYYNQNVIQYIRDNVSTKKKNSPTFSISITSREKDVLELICNQYTTTEIADKLYIIETTRYNKICLWPQC